jgi:ACS family glucarate transporter-like MFS transporter
MSFPMDAANATLPRAEKPTRFRYWVILFSVTLAVLAYTDRACISIAARFIREDLNLTTVQMGWVFFAFALAYALFEIPGGWMGDWLGPKRVLIRIVLWWSFFTAATGWAWNYASLLVTRFLFGMGEAGCFPNLTKAMTIWLPQRERVKAQGIMWTFARWGGAFTPPLMAATIMWMGWRWSFVFFGSLGLIWCAIFIALFKDNPREHKRVNAAELALLEGAEKVAAGHARPPWRKLATTPTVWMLWAQYFLISYPFYFYLTWLPTYLMEGRGLDLAQASKFAVFPLLFAGAGSLFSGMISGRVAQWLGSVSLARRTLGFTGFLAAGLFVLLHIQIESIWLAMLALGVATFFHDITTPGAWGACMDVGHKYAGTLSGSMNMMGNFGSMISPVAMGYILRYTDNNWTICLYSVAAAYLLGTLCWPFMDPVTPLEQRDKPAAGGG